MFWEEEDLSDQKLKDLAEGYVKAGDVDKKDSDITKVWWQ